LKSLHPEGGSSKVLGNTGIVSHHYTSQPRRTRLGTTYQILIRANTVETNEWVGVWTDKYRHTKAPK